MPSERGMFHAASSLRIIKQVSVSNESCGILIDTDGCKRVAKSLSWGRIQ